MLTRMWRQECAGIRTRVVPRANVPCVPVRNFAVSTHCVLQLLLGHPRAALNAFRFGSPIKFRLGRPAACTRARRLAAALGPVPRVLAAHGAAALATAARADVRLAFAFLLIGFAPRFLVLGLAQVPLILGLAVGFRRTRFAERDRDCLAAVLHLAALATWAAAQFAVLELVHHAAFDAALTWVRFGHGALLLRRPALFQRRSGTRRSGARGKSRAAAEHSPQRPV